METMDPPVDERYSDHSEHISSSSPLSAIPRYSPLSRSHSAERSPTAHYRRRDSSPSRLQTPRSISGLPPASRIPQRNIKDLVNRFNQAAGHGERPLMPPSLKDRYKRTEEQRAARLMKPRSPIKERHPVRAQHNPNSYNLHSPGSLQKWASDGNLRASNKLSSVRTRDLNTLAARTPNHSHNKSDLEPNTPDMLLHSHFVAPPSSGSEDPYDQTASTDEHSSDQHDSDYWNPSSGFDQKLVPPAQQSNGTNPPPRGSNTLRTPRPSRLTHPHGLPSPDRRREAKQHGSPLASTRSTPTLQSPDKPSRLPVFRSKQPPHLSTSATSRSRAGEKMSHDMSPEHSIRRRQHRRLPELGRVDFAERRARIERALSQNLGDSYEPSAKVARPSSPRRVSGRHPTEKAQGRHTLDHVAEDAFPSQEQDQSTDFEEESISPTQRRPTYLSKESDSDSIQITPIEYSRRDRELQPGSLAPIDTDTGQRSAQSAAKEDPLRMTGVEIHLDANAASATSLDPQGDAALYLPRTPIKGPMVTDQPDDTPRPLDMSAQDTPHAHTSNTSSFTDSPEVFMQKAILEYETTGHVNPALLRELERLGFNTGDRPSSAGSDVATIRVLLDRMTVYPPSKKLESGDIDLTPVQPGATSTTDQQSPNLSSAQPSDGQTNSAYDPSRSSLVEWHSDRPSTNTSFASGPSEVTEQGPTVQYDKQDAVPTDLREPRIDSHVSAQPVTPALASSALQGTPGAVHSYSLPEIDVMTPFNPGLGLGLDLGSPPDRPTSVPTMSSPRPQTSSTRPALGQKNGLSLQTTLDSHATRQRRNSEPSTPQSHVPSNNAAPDHEPQGTSRSTQRAVSTSMLVSDQASSSQMSLAASSTDLSLVTTPFDDPTVPTEVQRRVSRRRNIIRELVDTEYSYHQDLKIIGDIYKATCDHILGAEDKKILFGNADQVEAVSLDFFDRIRKSVQPLYVIKKDSRWNARRKKKNNEASSESEKESPDIPELVNEESDRTAVVGAIFEVFLPRMERVYANYVKNHEAANKRLAILQTDPKVAWWLRACHSNANDITSAWNLDSLLVKPVQRILKYPLLLQQLLSSTPEDYPDYEALRRVVLESTNVSQRINDAKKRADLVESMVNGKRKDSEIRAGLAKAFGMRSEKTKELIGLKSEFQDAVFEELSMKFGGHFVRLQVVMRDIQASLAEFDRTLAQARNLAEGLQNYMDLGSNMYPEIEAKWRKFFAATKELSTVRLVEYKDQVEKRVIAPIVAAIRLHERPQSIMAKRKKKVVDFVRRQQMERMGQKPDRKTLEASELYIALNDQLKIDLPKLYDLTAQLIQRCLACYHQIHMKWLQTWQSKLAPVVDSIPDSFEHIVAEHQAIFPLLQDQVLTLGLANGTLLADASQFLSPQISFTDEGRHSWNRSSHTQSIGSEFSGAYPYETSRGYSVTSLGYDSPSAGSTPALPSTSHRTRSMSNLSGNRVSSGAPPLPPPPAYPVPRLPPQYPAPSFAASRATHGRPSDLKPMTTNTAPATAPPSAGHGYTFSRSSNEGTQLTPPRPTSGRSASSYSATRDSRPDIAYPPTSPPPTPGRRSSHFAHPELRPAFVAVSLYAFNISRARKEAGYPYLAYGKGEVFEVARQQGELWLAWNQDDRARELGWIWEQHFVVLGEES